jgi:hypothetical protein
VHRVTDRLSRRIVELDATRGAAMLFVCISHSWAYVGEQHELFAQRLIETGMVATPTFLLLSGIVCGYLANADDASDKVFRWRLFDRGLFLLVVAHAVLGLIYSLWMGIVPALTGSFYITDAVAVGLITAAIVVRRSRPKTLAVAGTILFLLAMILANIDPVDDAIGRFPARLLFGVFDPGDNDEGYIVPLVAYLGIFLIGCACGVRYAHERRLGTTTTRLALACIGFGCACMGAALVMKYTWLWLKPSIDAEWQPLIYRLTEPRQKLPPGAGYVLWYGGAGAAVMGLLGLASNAAVGRHIVAVLAVVGRASLVVFIAQYFLFYVPTKTFHLGAGHWSVIFPTALVILWTIAWIWDHYDGNRFLTLGLRRIGAAKREDRKREPVPVLDTRE